MNYAVFSSKVIIYLVFVDYYVQKLEYKNWKEIKYMHTLIHLKPRHKETTMI